MATVVLTVVGTLIGGPIGGALGSLAGQMIDSQILSSSAPAREGSRLKELDVQTSSYGTQIPAVFGKMRVAGSVIWATDLVERRTEQGGGKGSPSVTTYSYFANLAVALSSRPVAAVGRIWADGKLLRGEAGDFKVPFGGGGLSATLGKQRGGFRFYSGHGDQPLDPFIASAEGVGRTPAHRGLAYAVFEGLPLEDYGNRIPSMTFELIENGGGCRLVDIAAYLSDGLIHARSGFAMTGFAASGRSARDALSPLVELAPARVKAGEAQLFWDDLSALSATDQSARIAQSIGGKAVPRPERATGPIGQAPRTIALRHYEEARDYQSGMQSFDRPGPGQVTCQIDFPAVVTAAQARQMAADQLFRAYRGRETMELHLLAGAAMPDAGDLVTLDGHEGSWLVEEAEFLAGAVRVMTRKLATQMAAVTGAADSGVPVRQNDGLAGPTRLVVMDLPVITGALADQPVIALAACGTTAAWRSAALFIDRGGGLESIGATARPAIMAMAQEGLPPAPAHLLDERSALHIELVNGADALLDSDAALIASGRNMAWLGGEIIQFARAEPVVEGRYRLSGLRRGLFGTEHRMTGHQPGEPFVLLEEGALRMLAANGLLPGQGLTLLAQGLGDAEPVEAALTVEGVALRPLAPVHGMALVQQGGGLRLRWVRRSRQFAGWPDGVDLPLGEDRERYALRLTAPDGRLLLETETATPEWMVSYAQRGLWAGQGVAIARCTVRQIGRHMHSLPLGFDVALA